jgi:two-component system sensor kinase FixL
MPDKSIDNPAGPGASRTDLAALMEAAVDAIIVIESDGKIVEFSRAAEQMFGFSADEVIGRPVDLLMPEPYRSQHSGFLDSYLKTGQAHIMGVGRQVRALRKNGEVFPVWLSVGESVAATGRHFVGIIRDLTEQHAAEHERRALELRLAHVSRLSVLGEMAAGIAHEINQPLAAITNYSQAAKNMLEHGNTDKESLQTACAGIAEQVQRAGDVIQNLRKFVRRREIEKERLSLRSLIEGVLVLINADATHAGVDVEIRVDENLPDVAGNLVQLQQVLLNLTRNAVDAMQGSSNAPKELMIEAHRAGTTTVQLSVSDRGPGVASGIEEAIFHPFFTTKREGLGIGLAISRSIVEAHGGSLSYEDRPGRGSTFTVTLPILDANE